MLKSGDKLFGIEINSRTFGYHVIWLVEDKKGHLFSVSKRKIKPLGKKKKKKNYDEKI